MTDLTDNPEDISELEENVLITLHSPLFTSSYTRFATFGDFLLAALYTLQEENPQGDFLTSEHFETLSAAAETSVDKADCFALLRQESGAEKNELASLFPRPGRTFSWRRLRKAAQKDDWTVPPLKQNAVIDKLVWLGFTPFLYSSITLVLFGLLFLFGVNKPVGPATSYVDWICLGIAFLYIVFLFAATGIEALFGLYVFPENVTTVDQLKRLIAKASVSRWVPEMEQKIQLEPLNEHQKSVAEELKFIVGEYLNVDPSDITLETPLKQEGDSQ